MTSEKEYISVVRVNRKGNPLVFKVIAKNINECSKDLRAKGYSILRLVSAKNNHICKYCNRLAETRYEGLLCYRCRKLFGHTLYSEL